jgi:hypothetical protein
MNASTNVIVRHVNNGVDFLINGAMRKIENELPDNEPMVDALRAVLGSIMSECDDWAESIDTAFEPDQITVGMNCARQPYNLTSAIIDLLTELDTLVYANDPAGRHCLERIERKIEAMRKNNDATYASTRSATSDHKQGPVVSVTSDPGTHCPPQLECPVCSLRHPIQSGQADRT